MGRDVDEGRCVSSGVTNFELGTPPSRRDTDSSDRNFSEFGSGIVRVPRVTCVSRASEADQLRTPSELSSRFAEN